MFLLPMQAPVRCVYSHFCAWVHCLASCHGVFAVRPCSSPEQRTAPIGTVPVHLKSSCVYSHFRAGVHCSASCHGVSAFKPCSSPAQRTAPRGTVPVQEYAGITSSFSSHLFSPVWPFTVPVYVLLVLGQIFELSETLT